MKHETNYTERIKMIKAMEFIARQINDEEIFEVWLEEGVAADAADEHNRLLDLRACLAQLGSQAQQLNRNIEQDTCNWIDVKNLIKSLISEARIRGLIK